MAPGSSLVLRDLGSAPSHMGIFWVFWGPSALGQLLDSCPHPKPGHPVDILSAQLLAHEFGGHLSSFIFFFSKMYFNEPRNAEVIFAPPPVLSQACGSFVRTEIAPTGGIWHPEDF